jgi:biotin carboxylase
MGDALLVAYDRGAASAAEIATGLGSLGPVVFAVADSEHTRRVGSVLAALGRVVPLSGDVQRDITRLREFAPAAVLTFSESMLPTVAALADAFGLPFHSPETTALLTDKTRQRERLRERGVEDVRGRTVSSLDEWPQARDFVGLPAVIKPVHGEGSRHTYAVWDEATATAVLASILPVVPESTVLVEELLQGRPDTPFGDYVSVESLCGPRGISHLAVTGKFPLAPPFRETGRFWPAAVSPEEREQITDLVTRALRALDVGIGLTHTEVKLTADGPRIIEVNGRLGGHIHGLARQVSGTDLIHLAGLLALGQDPDPPVGLDRPETVFFQHNTLAPVEPCSLVSGYGAADVRRMTGIDGFRAYARPGDVFEGSVMTRHIDLLWGRCRDHDDMRGILGEALRRLSYEFRFADGVRSVSAAELQWGAGAAAEEASTAQRRPGSW